jgi:raffinose/stachyose/melibiose transport system substrate-binding protein
MKKLFLVMLTLLLATSVFASAGQDSQAKPPVSFLINNAQVVTPYETLIAKYKAETGIDVQLGSFDATNEQQILTRWATKDYPDGFVFDTGTKQYTKFGMDTLYDWTNDPLFNNVLPATKEYQTLNGKIYGVPYGGTGTYGVYYNKDVFAKVGIQPPKNWADFISILDKIKAAGIIPIYEAQGTGWPMQVFFLASWVTYVDPVLGTDGVQKLNANQISMTDVPMIQTVMEMFYNLAQGGYFQQNYQAGTYEEQIEAVITGTAAMAFQIGNFASTAANTFDYDTVNKALGFFPIPSATDQGIVCLSPPQQILLPSGAKNLQGGIDFIHFLLRPENLQVLYEANPSIPVYNNVTANLMDYMKTASEFDAQGKATINVQNRLGSSFTDLVPVLQTLMIDGDARKAVQTLSENYKRTGKARALPGF